MIRTGNSLVDVLKEKFGILKEDLERAQENFQDIGQHYQEIDNDMKVMRHMTFLSWVKIMGHIKGKPVPYEKRYCRFTIN
jgi:hypothetical protein